MWQCLFIISDSNLYILLFILLCQCCGQQEGFFNQSSHHNPPISTNISEAGTCLWNDMKFSFTSFNFIPQLLFLYSFLIFFLCSCLLSLAQSCACICFSRCFFNMKADVTEQLHSHIERWWRLCCSVALVMFCSDSHPGGLLKDSRTCETGIEWTRPLALVAFWVLHWRCGQVSIACCSLKTSHASKNILNFHVLNYRTICL